MLLEDGRKENAEFSQRRNPVGDDWSAYQSLVVVVVADPEPREGVPISICEGALRIRNSRAPEIPDGLKVERWMGRILLEESELLVSGLLKGIREGYDRIPRNRATRTTPKASFISVRFSLGDRLELSGADLGLNSFNDVMAAAAVSKIALHFLSHPSMVWRLSHAARATWASCGSPAIASLMASMVIIASYEGIASYGEGQALGEARCSPAKVQSVEVVPVVGQPDPERTRTSIVERQSLSVRMGTRRFTRLTNTLGKK
jgi:hypothetical protein